MKSFTVTYSIACCELWNGSMVVLSQMGVHLMNQVSGSEHSNLTGPLYCVRDQRNITYKQQKSPLANTLTVTLRVQHILPLTLKSLNSQHTLHSRSSSLHITITSNHFVVVTDILFLFFGGAAADFQSSEFITAVIALGMVAVPPLGLCTME